MVFFQTQEGYDQGRAPGVKSGHNTLEVLESRGLYFSVVSVWRLEFLILVFSSAVYFAHFEKNSGWG